MACFIASGLLYYRAVTLTHELVHLRHGSFRMFRVVWNLLRGIPVLMPSSMYYTHLDHHRRSHYGTEHDGRYLPFRHRPRMLIVQYLLASLALPIIGFLRYFAVAPLGWIFPPLGRWAYRYMLSLVVDPGYVRRVGGESKVMRVVRFQEAACFLWCLGIVAVPPLVLHRWAIPFAIQAYFTAVFVIMINSLRTLGSHCWTNDGGEMSFEEQILDSLNYPYRPWFTELWGPVGMRFHALHHLFPSLPYHAMPEAHRRLMARLGVPILVWPAQFAALRKHLLR